VKRSELGPGRKSLERGSTFSGEPTPLKCQAPERLPNPGALPGDDDHATPPPRPRRQAPTPRPKRKALSASSAQTRKRRKIGACIVTGATEGIDSAHLWDRSLGGCDSKHCIVPLRRDIHEAYDRHEYDLLPHLLAHGCVAELQHALGHANGNLVGLLERLTGERWAPERTAA
jgi:hypothetical protein